MIRYSRFFESENRERVVKLRRNFMISSDFEFKECFRLNKEQVSYVVNSIGSALAYSSGRSTDLDPQQQVLLCLHWLGNGGQYHGIASMHGVHKSTVCRTVHRVVEAIVDKLLQNTVRFPEDTNRLASDFFEMGGFPSVCGCVDGTHVNIDGPSSHEEMFVNRHGKHSLNVMLICGPTYEFFAVNANWPGSVHDARVLRNSAVWSRFESGWRPFPGAVILGDSAYPTKSWLIPPLHRNPSDPAEQRYNKAHKSTRRIVENSIGKLFRQSCSA